MKRLMLLCWLSLVAPTLGLQAQEPLVLRLNLVPKIEYSMRLEANQKVTLVAKNKKETVVQSLSQEWIYDVREVRPDGTTLVGCKFVAISFDQKRPDGSLSWNSRDGKPAPDSIDYFPVLIGARFSLELERNGRIRRVLGLGELVERIIAFYNLSPQSAASVRSLMKSTIGSGTFKNIGNLMASFPDAPLQIGDSWKKLDPVSGDIPFDYSTTCTLQSRADGIATIGVRSVLKPKDAPKDQPPLQGAAQTGTLQVDEKTGWTNQAQVVLRSVTVSPQGRIYLLSEMKMARLQSAPPTAKVKRHFTIARVALKSLHSPNRVLERTIL